MGGITRPLLDDGSLLNRLNYISDEQNMKAVRQGAAEVKQGKKERPIGDILKEQTKDSKTPITQKELDYCETIRKKYSEEYKKVKPEKGKAEGELLEKVIKDLKIPQGKVGTKEGAGDRVGMERAWDPEHLLAEASKPSREATMPVERNQHHTNG